MKMKILSLFRGFSLSELQSFHLFKLSLLPLLPLHCCHFFKLSSPTTVIASFSLAVFPQTVIAVSFLNYRCQLLSLQYFSQAAIAVIVSNSLANCCNCCLFTSCHFCHCLNQSLPTALFAGFSQAVIEFDISLPRRFQR